MSGLPTESVLSWAAEAVGTGARVIAAKALHEGRTGPWMVQIDHAGGTSDVVLRLVVPGWIGKAMIATGAAALLVAEEHGLAAPRLIASDLNGRATGVVATLETAVPGSSAMPARVSAERLREAGAAIARVHKVPLEPRRHLPLRTRPTQTDDHAMERRMSVTHSTPLLQLADDRVREIPRPQETAVFVHGDIWAGNMMWSGDICTALIDWKTAGVGDPGVDLGNLRMHMAVQYGSDAPAYVLEGWRRESGREATNVAYWDTVAALQTPVDLDDWEPGFDDQGNRLGGSDVTERRNAFLRAALDRLERDGVTHG